MKVAPLAYRSVLAHLLPGFVALYPLSAFVPFLRVVPVSSGQGLLAVDLGGSLMLLATALVAGLTLDAVRYVSVDIALNRVFYGRGSAKYMELLRSNADLQFYESVIDTSYAFYQFYINTALAIASSLLLWQIGWLAPLGTNGAVIALGTMSVLALAGVRAAKAGAQRIRYRFGFTTRKENEMSNGPGHPLPPPPPPPPMPGPMSRKGAQVLDEPPRPADEAENEPTSSESTANEG